MNLNDPRIDWNRQAGYKYVVVGPKGNILYLDEVMYLRMTRVWDSNEVLYTVLAEPTSVRPTPSPSESTSDTESPSDAPSEAPSELPAPSTKRTKTSPPPSWWRWGRKLFTEFLKFTPSQPEGPKSGKSISKKDDAASLSFNGTLVVPTKRNFGRLFKAWAQKASWLTGKPPLVNHVVSLQRSTSFLIKLLDTGGIEVLIAYLKVSYITVLKYIAGERLRKTSHLGASVKLDRSGLPRWMPLTWRNWIRCNDSNGIRFVLSVLYMYRALTPKRVKPDFSTIAAPAFTGDISQFSNFVVSLFAMLKIKPFPKASLVPEPVPSLRGGPNASMMIRSIFLDALAWMWMTRDSSVNYIDAWIQQLLLQAFPNFEILGDRKMSYVPFPWIKNPLSATRSVFPRTASSKSAKKVSTEQSYDWLLYWRRQLKNFCKRDLNEFSKIFGDGLSLGRLAWWGDSGGKTRIVALPDFWTQTLLKPVHDCLAAILKMFPQDATFDQSGVTREFAQRGYQHLWSFDLKAATDLIPQDLYLAVLRILLGNVLAELWIKLLTDREYVEFSSIDRSKPATPGNRKVKRRHKYTRGQPMGAYSSWPSMALVHHIIVFYSAFRAGKSQWWAFVHYLVLGDDVVIADKDVAAEYLVVCAELGITVSISKSFISNTGMFQFASQVYLKGVNLSPASLREELQNVTPSLRATSCYRLLRNWYPDGISLSRMIRMMTPRTAWSEIRPCFEGGSAHPLALVILRTLVTPASILTDIVGSPEASLIGWLGSFDPKFNLRSYLSKHTNLSGHAIHSEAQINYLRAAILKLFNQYQDRLRDLLADCNKYITVPLKSEDGLNLTGYGPKQFNTTVESIADQLRGYFTIFKRDLHKKRARLNVEIQRWGQLTRPLEDSIRCMDPVQLQYVFARLLSHVSQTTLVAFDGPWAEKAVLDTSTRFAYKAESWLYPGLKSLTMLDDLNININALDIRNSVNEIRKSSESVVAPSSQEGVASHPKQ